MQFLPDDSYFKQNILLKKGFEIPKWSKKQL